MIPKKPQQNPTMMQQGLCGNSVVATQFGRECKIGLKI